MLTLPGLLQLTTPTTMKLSKLRALCDKAIEKYGDMTVGVYDKDGAFDIDHKDDMCSFRFRILSQGACLPGEIVDMEEENADTPKQHFACIFYEN